MTIQGNVHPAVHGRIGLHEFRQVFVVSILQRKGSQVIGRMWLVGELVAGLISSAQTVQTVSLKHCDDNDYININPCKCRLWGCVRLWRVYQIVLRGMSDCAEGCVILC